MEDNNLGEGGADGYQFDDPIKDMQNQIKDKVISKYLVLIEHQSKEISELKKENALLKDQLTFVLKKILLNKNDYRTNRLNTDVSNNNVDNKVSGYLESLYRTNINNSNKAGGDFFLNKNQTLVEELFPNKNNSFYMNTENEQLAYDNNKNKAKPKRENKSTGQRYKSKYLDANNSSTKKRKKESSYLDNNDRGKYNTINNGSRVPKNKPKRPIIYTKRSPFLANKF